MNVSAPYDEQKAAQAAGLFLKLNGGKENLLKLVKLLYAVERESIKRWLCPFTYDTLVSMPHGQVVSHTYDNIKSNPASGIWGDSFRTVKEGRGKTVYLEKECGTGKLSKADIGLITETYEKNKNKSPEEMESEHHDQSITPEWVDPGRSSIKTAYPQLLKILGKTPEEIESFAADLKEMAFISLLKC